MSRSRRAIWNYGSVLLFTAVTTIVGLATTRWLIGTASRPGWLGASKFGSFRMAVDWLGYLTLLDLSLGGILGPLLARASATDDEANLRGVVGAGLRAYLALALTTLALGLGMFLVIDRLVAVPSGDRTDLRIAWLVLLLGIPPMVLSPYRALADARQLGYRINLLLTAQSLVIFGTSLGLAWLGWGMFGQALAVTLPTWPLALALAGSGISRHPGLGLAAWRTGPDPDVWRTIRSLGAPTLLALLGSRLGVLTDAIVAGDILGPAMATRLIVSTRLASLAQSQLQAVGNASWAALAELHARGERETFNLRLVELTGLVTVLGVAGLGPVVAYNRHFVALWLGPEAYGGDGLIAVAAFNALVMALTSLWYWCFSGTGQVRRMVPVAVSSGVLNLAASLYFTHRFWPGRPPTGDDAGLHDAQPLVPPPAPPVDVRDLAGLAGESRPHPIGLGSPLSGRIMAHRRGAPPLGLACPGRRDGPGRAGVPGPGPGRHLRLRGANWPVIGTLQGDTAIQIIKT